MVGEYFDPHFPARIEGQRQGQLEGFAAGQAAGYAAGHADGYSLGWNEGVDCANEEMRKQLEYTRQHAERNASLTKLTTDQHALIVQMRDELQVMEAEQGRLRGQLEKSEGQLRLLGADHICRYNQIVLCMNTLRGTIDAVLHGSVQGQQSIRAEFMRHYDIQMRLAMTHGTVHVAVDRDEAFAQALPKMHRFLVSMLRPSEFASQSDHAVDPRR